jgi:hypothetical protein
LHQRGANSHGERSENTRWPRAWDWVIGCCHILNDWMISIAPNMRVTQLLEDPKDTL